MLIKLIRGITRRREARAKRKQDEVASALLIEARTKRIAMVAELEGIDPSALEDALSLIAGSSALSTDQALSIAESIGLAGVQALGHGADD